MASELTGSKSSRKFRADIEGLRGEEKPKKCRRTARIYSRMSTCNYTKIQARLMESISRRLEGCLPTGNRFIDK